MFSVKAFCFAYLVLWTTNLTRVQSLRCHFGHHLTSEHLPTENTLTTVECDGGVDSVCLKAEAITIWYIYVPVSYEGAVCSSRAACLNASAECKSLLSDIINDDEDLGNSESVQFRNCTWACCNDDLCNKGTVANIKDSYKHLSSSSELTTPAGQELTTSGSKSSANARAFVTILTVLLSTNLVILLL